MPPDRKGSRQGPQPEKVQAVDKIGRKAALRAARYLGQAMVSTGDVARLPRTFEALEGEFNIGGQDGGQK